MLREIPAPELRHASGPSLPPQGFVGTAKLTAELRLSDNKIADRQAIHFAWESPISPAPVLLNSKDLQPCNCAHRTPFRSNPIEMRRYRRSHVSPQGGHLMGRRLRWCRRSHLHPFISKVISMRYAFKIISLYAAPN